MIEKSIFKVIKKAFEKAILLRDIKLLTFDAKGIKKPFVLFKVENVGADTANIQLEIDSDYKGISESVSLAREIKKTLENDNHQDGAYCYVFRKSESEKVMKLVFKVKRFKTGE